MRITIRLDDELLCAAKALALRTGRTLAEVIEDALRQGLQRRTATGARRERVSLPTVGGEGLVAGVNLDDTTAILDLLEERR